MDLEHRASDEQSLQLTRAAIAALRSRPALLRDVEATLDHWDRVAPLDSKSLRDEWRRILAAGAWAQVLDLGPRGQQLRRASPLGKALAPAVRLQIIRQCKGRNSST